MKLKQILLVIAISIVSALASVMLYSRFSKNANYSVQNPGGKLPVNYAGYSENGASIAEGPTDFTKAAMAALPAVVHIKTKTKAKRLNNQLPRNGFSDEILEQLFGDGLSGQQFKEEQKASGSGVIISEDGYIVTNNHVISDGEDGIADEINVTLNKTRKTYKARVIGTHPSTDIAVLKIDATALPYIVYGNSDNLKIGQWVLAVGYPFNFEATVTAGIVSATARSLGINQRQSNAPIESFIQTDAAVNQGNSGGALISADGQLIGINSAIYAPSGTYAGYSFAIPVSIVKKAVADLIEFGEVKRAYLGVTYSSEGEENEKSIKNDLGRSINGIYTLGVSPDGAAKAAGIKKGDVITKIDGSPVESGAQLMGLMATKKPSDKVSIEYVRANKTYTTTATLTGEVKAEVYSGKEYFKDKLGLELENLDAKEAAKYDLEGGVMIKRIFPNSKLKNLKLSESFIITGINGRKTNTIEDMYNVIAKTGLERIKISGTYPGSYGTYSFETSLADQEESGRFD